jgi:hypothetical protein
MAVTNYPFTKVAQPIQLQAQIAASAIVTALESIVLNGTNDLNVSFKDALSGGDETILNGLVTAHTPVAITVVPESVAIISQPDPVPFAQPTYRTKRDGSAAWKTCAENTTTNDDFLLSAERYVSGGDIFYKDAKEGDYLTAEVRDIDGVIPEAYRAALCEAHPTVATYVVKAWVLPITGYGKISVDTYPLNAKISAGLYLRVSYHATSEAGDRKMVVNYHLTKKL